MSFSTELQGRTATVRVGTELDYRNADAFKSECQQVLARGIRSFILDFSGVKILDSSGLGAIFHLYRQLNRQEGSLALASLSPAAETAIRVVRLPRLVPCFANCNAAQMALDG